MDLTQLLYQPYVRALIALVGFFLIAKLVVFVSEKVILKFTKKTKTKIDDLIVERINRPISLLLIFIGARFALIPLALKESINLVLSRIISSFVIIIVVYIGVVVLDILIDVWGKRFAEKRDSGKRPGQSGEILYLRQGYYEIFQSDR